MAGFQQIIIVGNVGQDPETRFTRDGKQVTNFSVAVNEKWGKEPNQQKTTWFRVSTWEKQAEVCLQYVRKGMQVQVLGTVDASAYTNHSGQAAASLEVRAQNVLFLGSKADNEAQDQAPVVEGETFETLDL